MSTLHQASTLNVQTKLRFVHHNLSDALPTLPPYFKLRHCYFSRGWQTQRLPKQLRSGACQLPSSGDAAGYPSSNFNDAGKQRASSATARRPSLCPAIAHGPRSPELAAGHARQLCWHAPSTERSRTNTRDAPRLALAGKVPLPGALADGPTRCSRTAFAGTVPGLGQPRARGRTRETTLLARSLDRALADGHARCSKTSFSWHSSPARSARRRTHEMLKDSLCWHRAQSRPAQSSRPDTRDAPRLALAGIVPLPGALADGPTRCSRTAFAGTVPGLGQPRARGRTRETTLLARSLERALADGHARCSKTSFSWHSSPARSARRRTHEMPRTAFAGTAALPRALNEELLLPEFSTVDGQ